MNGQNWLEVIDRDGWQKKYPLDKSIAYIGSHPRSDIILEGGRGHGVAPLHAQLIASHNQPGYQLVNLADEVIFLGLSGEQTLPPRSSINIVDGTSFRMGDFILVFHGNGERQSGITNQGGSRYIGLSVAMPHTRLAPHQSLDGIITVHNLGERTGVKFDLELEGLDDDCFDLEPGPLLSSGAEKEVIFRLYHRGAKPMAGDWRIAIRATAPRGYPGEQALVTQVIQILPFYRHRLSLISPTGSRTSVQPPEEDSPPLVKKQPHSPAPVSRPASPEGPEAPNYPMPVSPVAPVQSTQGGGPADDWWAAPVEAEPRRPAAAAAPVKPTPQTEDSSPLPTRPERPPKVNAQPLPQEKPKVSGSPSTPQQSKTRPAKVVSPVSPPPVEPPEVKPAPSSPATVEPQPVPPVTSEPSLSTETELVEPVTASSPAQVQQPLSPVEAEPSLSTETPPVEQQLPAASSPAQVEPQVSSMVEAEPLLPVETEAEPIAPADTSPPRQRWWQSWRQWLPFYRRQPSALPEPDEPTSPALVEADLSGPTDSLPPETDIPISPAETTLLPSAEPELEAQVEADLLEQIEEPAVLPVEADAALPPTSIEQTMPAEAEPAPSAEPKPELAPQAEAGLPTPPVEEPAIDSPQSLAEPPPVSEETQAWWTESLPVQTDLPESAPEQPSNQAEWDISTLERSQPARNRNASLRTQTEDWWTEADSTEETSVSPTAKPGVISIQAGQANAEQVEVEEAASTTKDEWGAAEDEPVTSARQRRALRLKTTPLQKVESEPAQPAQQKPAEDWWTE